LINQIKLKKLNSAHPERGYFYLVPTVSVGTSVLQRSALINLRKRVGWVKTQLPFTKWLKIERIILNGNLVNKAIGILLGCFA
jgi:hypothetical protein